MHQKIQMNSVILGIILLLLGACFIPFITIVKADITWDVQITCNNPGDLTDYVVFGEATDANNGPPADSYDVIKPPLPMTPYIRAVLSDNLPEPYDTLSNDTRHYPGTSKIWNLTVQWMPSSGSSPTTITLTWNTAEFVNCEYNSVTLCNDGGNPLQNMRINSSYSFSCPAYVPQNFKIICTIVNQPPVLTDIPNQTITEGSTFSTINLDNYVSDPDNTDAQMTWTYSGNTQLTVSIVSRVATITIPNLDWTGAETITFRATDPGALWDADPATFTVTNADNDPPVVTNIPGQTISEGATFSTISLDNYVSDPDNTDAQMTWTYSGSSELLVSIVSRVATITTPNADWYGSETITFRATDPGALWDDDSATFTVTAVNDPPVVTNIPDQTISEGATFSTINLDTYVSDVDNTDAQMTWTYSGNTQLTVNIVTRVATITIPSPDWTGTETITFRATDPEALWDDDPATLTVTSADNDPPIVTNIPNQTISEGATFSTISLDNYVSDPDNTDAQMTWTYSGNTQLTVSIVARIATITIPNLDWTGAETITFRATDPGALWDDDSATFTVTAVNDPPVVTNIPDQTISEGATFSTINLDTYVSDVDNTDAQMTWTYSGNTQLTVNIVTRVATITIPSPDWTGTETITFRATDPEALWDDDPATFTVTTATNNSPIFGTPTPTNTSLNNPLSLTWSILITDPENDTFNWTIQCSNKQSTNANLSSNGVKTLAVSGLTNSKTYKVWVNATDPTGSDTYTRKWYTFTTKSASGGGGGGGGSGGGEEPPNTAPTADASASQHYGTINTPVRFNGSRSIDPDGSLTNWAWDFGDTTNGTGETTTHSYPQAGTYTVTLTVTDNDNAIDTDTMTVIISLTQQNTPPTPPIINGINEGTKNKPYTYSVYSTDQENDLLQYTITWGDGTQNTSTFLQNETHYSVAHSWTTAGIYLIAVTATDSTTMSERATLTVFIDVYFVHELGFLFDSDNDGLIDSFYTNSTGRATPAQKLANESYNLDTDADGKPNYIYNPSLDSLTEIHTTATTEGFPWIYVAILLIVLLSTVGVVVFLRRNCYI